VFTARVAHEENSFVDFSRLLPTTYGSFSSVVVREANGKWIGLPRCEDIMHHIGENRDTLLLKVLHIEFPEVATHRHLTGYPFQRCDDASATFFGVQVAILSADVGSTPDYN
jgi:hypothetical protein